jgi:hypothetical protein
MPARPKTIKVLHATYNVQYVKEDFDLGDDAYGVCIHDRLTIKISRTAPKDIIKSTLWHECLHCVYYWYGVLDYEDEEPVVNKIATGTLQFMLDNPQAMQYITNNGTNRA